MFNVRRTKVAVGESSVHTGLLLCMQHCPEQDLRAICHALGLQNVCFMLQVASDGGNHSGQATGRRHTGRLLSNQFDFVLLNFIINGRQVLFRQITIVVQTRIVFDKVLECHSVLDLRVVGIRIEHNDRVRQLVCRVSIGKGSLVALRVPLGKLEHEPVNLLCFAWQPERLKEASQSRCQWHVAEIHQIHKGMHRSNVLGVAFAQVFTDGALTESVRKEEEARNSERIIRSNKPMCDQLLNTALGLKVESADGLQ